MSEIKRKIDKIVAQAKPKQTKIDITNPDIIYFFKKTINISGRDTAMLFEKIFKRKIHHTTVIDIRRKLNLTE